MFCKHCGAELPDNSKFCPNCGQTADSAPKPTEAPGAAPAPQPAMPQPPVDYPPVPPQADFAQPVYEGVNPETEPPKKKKGKRVLISVLVAVLVLALVGGGLAYALVFRTPEHRLERAWDKTEEAFSQLYGNCGNLKQGLSNLLEMREAKQAGLDITASVEGEEISLVSNIDGVKKEMRMDITQPYSTDPLVFYVNEEMMAFTVEGYMEDSYYLPLENLGDELVNAGLLDADQTETIEMLNNLDIFKSVDFDMEEFRASHAKQIESFQATASLEKTDRTIAFADAASTFYEFRMDWQAGMDLILEMYREMGGPVDTVDVDWEDAKESLENTRVLLGVNGQGYLNALQVETEDGTFALLLNGEDNPWETVTITDGEAILGQLLATSTKDGFRWDFRDEEEEELVDFHLEWNDAAGTVTATSEEGEVIVNYGCENGGFQLSYDGTVDTPVKFSLDYHPMGEVKPLNAPINLLTLSQEDMQMAMMEVIYGLGIMP